MITTTLFAIGAFCTAPAVPSHESPATSHAWPNHDSRITNHETAIHDSRSTIHGPRDSTYQSLYQAGQAFADFVAGATARKAQWEANYALKVAPDALVARARATGTGWKLLVVTVPGCSDSVNSVPYIASFLDSLPGIEMRLVNSTQGRAVMEAHRTPDGRAATPTVILLDDQFNERGCWIERPAPLIAFMREGGSFDGKMAWYDRDRGASTLEEIVAMMEAAAAGGRRC